VLRRLTLAALVAALAAAGSAQASTVVLPDCAWQLRSDPVAVNALYPDQDAVYYIAYLPAPPAGVSYRIRGRFPHARYTSFVSYNGLPMDALSDVDIAPDAGSTNPFIAGADRTATKRSYTVKLVTAATEPGALYVGGGQLGTPAPAFYVFYRIYVPDRGRGLRGGVPLPRIVADAPGDGELDLDLASCDDARTALDAAPLPGAQEQYAQASVPATGLPALRSDTSPPTWTVESGLTAAALDGAGQGDLVSGGPGSNPHNRYLAAAVSRALGEVIVIHGRAPTTPPTINGEKKMRRGDLRYWSFCQNSRTTRYVACLSDSNVVRDAPRGSPGDRDFTIVISDPAYRPATARNWLPFGPEPEGQVLYRHMLPSAAFFPYSVQGVASSGVPVQQAMGEYYPRAVYCTAAQFDKDACGLQGGTR